MLSLSTEEIKAARKALWEVKAFDALRPNQVWVVLLISISPAIRAFDHLKSGHLGLLDILISIGLPCALLFRWREMSYLKSRYAANQRFLQELRDSNKCSFDDVTELVEAHEEPLLEFWNRRLEKRAILWRVDAFLSGKKVTE